MGHYLSRSHHCYREPASSVWLADKLSNTLRFQLVCLPSYVHNIVKCAGDFNKWSKFVTSERYLCVNIKVNFHTFMSLLHNIKVLSYQDSDKTGPLRPLSPQIETCILQWISKISRMSSSAGGMPL